MEADGSRVEYRALGKDTAVINDLLPRQVVCNEKNAKGKPCHGSLKRYYPFAGYYNEPDNVLRQEIESEFGKKKTLVLLKCEKCAVVLRLPGELKVKFG